jgi:hypothetical protein
MGASESIITCWNTEKKIFLAPEILVDGAFADTGRTGHIDDAGGRVAALGEDLDGRADDVVFLVRVCFTRHIDSLNLTMLSDMDRMANQAIKRLF